MSTSCIVGLHTAEAALVGATVLHAPLACMWVTAPPTLLYHVCMGSHSPTQRGHPALPSASCGLPNGTAHPRHSGLHNPPETQTAPCHTNPLTGVQACSKSCRRKEELHNTSYCCNQSNRGSSGWVGAWGLHAIGQPRCRY